MATLKKKPNRLGEPPKPTEVRNNLAEPEVAPASTEKPKKKVDGRTLVATGRNKQFNTTVSEAYLKDLRAIAKKEGRTLGKMLELSLEAWKKENL